jgi:hypothetical protein
MTYTVERITDTRIMAPVKVIDKRKKDGWFSQSFYIMFRSLDPDFINRGDRTVFELPATQQNYYDLAIGDIIRIYFYKHSDGRWYQTKE